MSEQPPYTPYSPDAYPNPYQQGPQRPNHTTRNVLIIVGVVIVFCCGGIVSLGAWIFHSVDDALDSDYPGSESDPVVVAEGDAFSIRGFDYAAGWSVTPRLGTGTAGGLEADNDITGLQATNNREDDDTEDATLSFDFYADDVLLGQVRCSTPGLVSSGRKAQLSCSSYSQAITGYDEIEVYDTSYFE